MPGEIDSFVAYLRSLFSELDGNAHALITQIEHKLGILMSGAKPDAGQLDAHVSHTPIAAAQQKVVDEFHKNLPSEAIAESKAKHDAEIAAQHSDVPESAADAAEIKAAEMITLNSDMNK